MAYLLSHGAEHIPENCHAHPNGSEHYFQEQSQIVREGKRASIKVNLNFTFLIKSFGGQFGYLDPILRIFLNFYQVNNIIRNIHKGLTMKMFRSNIV